MIVDNVSSTPSVRTRCDHGLHEMAPRRRRGIHDDDVGLRIVRHAERLILLLGSAHDLEAFMFAQPQHQAFTIQAHRNYDQ
jgi:hypothetical protein